MWQTGQEVSLGENEYKFMYAWVPSLFTWNYHNIINWLYLNTKKKVKTKNSGHNSPIPTVPIRWKPLYIVRLRDLKLHLEISRKFFYNYFMEFLRLWNEMMHANCTNPSTLWELYFFSSGWERCLREGSTAEALLMMIGKITVTTWYNGRGRTEGITVLI